MKRIFTFFLLVTLYSFGTLQTASAIFCTNCSQAMLQVPQLAKDIITAGADVITSANTTITRINDTVLDPMANTMIALVQVQRQLKTINFITAVFGNEGSLLIQNPEQWLKNKKKAAITISLGSVAQSNGLYKDSLLGSLVSTYKGADDLQSTIKDVTSSNVPNAVQKNICNDSSLTNLAKNDVMNSDGSYDPALVQKKKAELYTKLCTSNPLTNAQLSKTLMTINEQLPQIGGWQAWLLTTGGDNEYNKSIQLKLAVSEAAAAKEAAARDDLNRGGGIASKTECLERAFPINDDEGNAVPQAENTTLPCAVEQITNTGSALNSAFQEAINAPLRKLQSSFGSGVFKSLSSIMTIISSSQELANAFSGSSPKSSGSSSNNSPSSASVQLTSQQDLTDPAQQTETAGTVRKPLITDLNSLSRLESIEKSFLNELATYEAQVGDIRMCYDKLVEDYPNSRNQTISAYAFINEKQSYIDSQKTIANKNLNNITTARTLINQTLAYVDSSKSTSDILNKFTSYQKEVESRGLPDATTATLREADLITIRGDMTAENGEDGRMVSVRNQCAQIRSTQNQSAGDSGA